MKVKMLNRRDFFISSVALSFAQLASVQFAYGATSSFPFYAMDTGLRGPDVSTLEQKIALLAKLGFSGIGWTWNPAEATSLLKLLDQHKLQLWAVYLAPSFDEEPNKALLEFLPSLKGRPTRIELALRSKKYKSSDPEGDAPALQYTMAYVEKVKESGPLISFYPHKSFWMEKVEDGLRLAAKANLANLGTHFNLVHWRWQKGSDEKKILQIGKKYIFCITINGMKDDSIVSLESGNYDVAGFLESVKASGWIGPIGLQSYSVQGNSADHLGRSFKKWQEVTRNW